MPPAYKRLDRDECVFLFVDHQVGYIILLRGPRIAELIRSQNSLGSSSWSVTLTLMNSIPMLWAWLRSRAIIKLHLF